jgi:HSP20 family protein
MSLLKGSAIRNFPHILTGQDRDFHRSLPDMIWPDKNRLAGLPGMTKITRRSHLAHDATNHTHLNLTGNCQIVFSLLITKKIKKMETKAVSKVKAGWPSLFNKDSWVDKFFDLPLDANFNFSRALNVPAINVKETEQEYKLSIAVPGLEKNDFDIQLSQGVLTISAEKEESKNADDKYNRREYNYSSWTRSFTLPEDAVDGKISAEYKNGELKIDVPKSGDKKKSEGKHIEIR